MFRLHLLILMIFLLCFASFICDSNHSVHKQVKIFLDEEKNIIELSQLGLAIESNKHKPGKYIVCEISKEEIGLISEAGFEYDILIKNMTSYYQERNKGLDVDSIMKSWDTKRSKKYQTPENFGLGSMGGFHTYSELLDELDDMADKFPHLISQRQPISDTLKSIEDSLVYWVRVSNDPENLQDKPRILYTALTHAREPGSMQQMLFQIWHLLENYETDSEIKYLVDNLEIYFIPAVNPDGYLYIEELEPDGGAMHRKNMRDNGDGSIGVDLNRNFGYNWGYDDTGSSPNPSSQTYRGTGPFSEPETKLLKIFAESKNFLLALNNHTFSDLLIYPWGYDSSLTPDSLIFEHYAKLMTRENNYVYGTVYETLNYYANGVSDDWFYGEQDTKDKVFAFTPEAGSSRDGFWPAIDRIEEICAGHVGMNTYLARLALSYAEITQTCPKYIEEIETSFDFDIKNYGLGLPANFEVFLEPLTDNIIEIGEPKTYSNMEMLEKKEGEIDILLCDSTHQGEKVEFLIHLDNGEHIWTDTIVKYFGSPVVAFHEPCEDLSKWETDEWDITNEVYYTPPSSIADSPENNYSNNSYNTIITKQPVDLSASVMAYAVFFARWEIEANYDYVQFMVSKDDGETWTAMEGRYTLTGKSNQDEGNPVYEGNQDEWVKEIIDLNDFTGEEILLKFRLVSDNIVRKEGFFFDELKVYHIKYPKPEITGHSELKFDMNTSFVFEKNYLQVKDPFFNYPEDFELTIYEGENYTIDNNTIYPEAEFYGYIFVPLSVSNDYKSSETYIADIEIEKVTSIYEKSDCEIRFFYNRLKEAFVLKINATCKNFQTLQIYDITGQILFDFNVERNKNVQFFTAKSLSKGVYLYELSGENNIKSGKIIVD